MLTRQLSADVHLRLPELRDAEALYAVIDAERERLARWMPWAAGGRPSDTEAFIRDARQRYADETGLALLVVRRGRPAGTVDLHRIDWANRAATIGYWLAAEAEGEGTMTRAAGALVEHAFTRLGLHRLELRAALDNVRSRAVAERLGFTLEGEARDAERFGDAYRTLAVYARLAGDGGGAPPPAASYVP